MSLRKAINAMCRECVYDPAAEGTWKMQVFSCQGTRCPLYPYRPLPAGVKRLTDRTKRQNGIKTNKSREGTGRFKQGDE